MLQEPLRPESRWYSRFDNASTRTHRKPATDGRLQPNPFITYRDPQTGRWIVVRPSAEQPQEPSLNQAITMPPSMLITCPVM